MTNQNPTHVGYAVDQHGQKRSGPYWLERNPRGNWVRFRIQPGEWDPATGLNIYTYEGDWFYRLQDVRPITREELVQYWKKDLVEAERARRQLKRDVDQAEQRLEELRGSHDACVAWVQSATDQLEAARRAADVALGFDATVDKEK